jgi:hypothetical protein
MAEGPEAQTQGEPAAMSRYRRTLPVEAIQYTRQEMPGIITEDGKQYVFNSRGDKQKIIFGDWLLEDSIPSTFVVVTDTQFALNYEKVV